MKSNYIEQQKERGLQIIRDLYDLNKTLPAIKVTEGIYFNYYDENKMQELEERVRNWQLIITLEQSVSKLLFVQIYFCDRSQRVE